MGNPDLLSGLQAGVGGDLWRGTSSSSSGSGVWEVAISKGCRELALGESFLHHWPWSQLSRRTSRSICHDQPDKFARITRIKVNKTQGYKVPGTLYLLSKKLLHFSAQITSIKILTDQNSPGITVSSIEFNYWIWNYVGLKLSQHTLQRMKIATEAVDSQSWAGANWTANWSCQLIICFEQNQQTRDHERFII